MAATVKAYFKSIRILTFPLTCYNSAIVTLTGKVSAVLQFEGASLNKAPPRVRSNFLTPNKVPLRIVIIYKGALITVKQPILMTQNHLLEASGVPAFTLQQGAANWSLQSVCKTHIPYSWLFSWGANFRYFCGSSDVMKFSTHENFPHTV